jgi:toluene monooxygenase system ferredoxin subunit
MVEPTHRDSAELPRWLNIMRLSDLPTGHMREVELADGGKIALARIATNHVAAFPAACPHRGAPLIDGQLVGNVLTCVAHRWRFDLTTGAGVFPRGCRLAIFDTAIVDDSIMIALSERDGESAQGTDDAR